MKRERELELAAVFRKFARYTSLVIGLFLFAFALFAEYEDNGGGISGFIMNGPKTLPWLMLLLSIFVAWRRELSGGILIIVLGFALLYYFNFRELNLFSVQSGLAFIIILFGSAFILSWYFRIDKK